MVVMANYVHMYVSETHLTRDIQLKRYNSYITHSNSNTTYGLVYFRQQYNVIKIGEMLSNYNYWISAYKVTVKNNQIVIVAVCRSPSSCEVEFCRIFEEIMGKICEFPYNIIIAGDLNIDWSKKRNL